MSPAILATGKNMKRVRVFLGKDGQKYEGTIEDYKTAPKVLGDDLGGTTSSDRLPGEDKTLEESKKK